jgi:8-oxo-dGTP pyrophosphatase MutT (NUDIX family)
VAVRETEEEVGLTLGPADECIGRLSDINARPHKGAFGMAVSPFVFRLEREVEFSPNHEVAEVVWVPLEFLLDTNNRQESRVRRFPCPVTSTVSAESGGSR